MYSIFNLIARIELSGYSVARVN